MSYGTYQNPTQLVAPYLSNGFRSTFTSGQKPRKMNRSQDHPKGDFILDGIKMAVSDGNRTMLKARIEKVEHYREHNSFTTKLNNGAHRPRKKQLRKVPKTHHQQVNASFYVLKEDESIIRKFLIKMREKEEEVASNIQRIVDEEYESLDRRSGKRYQKIFHDVHKRIAPERPGIKYFNYLDPETMVKLDIANVNHRKSPISRDGAADSLSEFPPVPAHYEDWERPETTFPMLKPNSKLRSHRPRLSVIDEAEEKKARGIIRAYANRSCSPVNGSAFLKEERQKIKTATNYHRGVGDSGSMTNSDFAKTAYSSARDGFMRPTRRRIESMDGRVQVKIESEDAQRAARRAFLTKNSSKNTRAENYYPIENEYWSGGDSFIALIRAQEKIDHSCGMLRSQIHKSRDESAYHKRSVSDIERPPENTANLRILNVKHSNGALDISPSNQPPEGYEPNDKKKKKKSQEEILPTESISGGGIHAEEDNAKYFDLLSVQHQDIKNLDLKKLSDYIENIDLNQSPREGGGGGAKRTSAKDLPQVEKEPLSEIRGLEEKLINDHLNFENITSSGLRSPEEGWKEPRNSSRDPRKRSDSTYKSRAPAKIKPPRSNITDVIGGGRLDSVNEDTSSSKRVTSNGVSGESKKLETRKSEESNKSGSESRSGKRL